MCTCISFCYEQLVKMLHGIVLTNVHTSILQMNDKFVPLIKVTGFKEAVARI